MKKDDIITYGLIGLGIYLLVTQRQRPQVYYPAIQQQLPAPPPQGTPQWAGWVQLVLQTGIDVAELFAPGGPFHSYSDEEINQALASGGFTPIDIVP